MADELNTNAEFSGKHQDEEDPILTAQRYLNVYRQIHIFNKKRQDEFDDSLLALSSDLRILLSTLPGGSLLLDHLAELEEQRGIVNVSNIAAAPKKDKASKKAARSEATIKTNAKHTDNSAASESIMQILQQNEEQHTRELQALTNAFLLSQERLTNVLQQVLSSTADTPIKTVVHESAKQPVVELPVVEDKKETVKNKNEETKTQKETVADNTDDAEDKEPETSEAPSKIFNFTKKLFRKTTEETEAPKLSPAAQSALENNDTTIVIDNTPVSLDDISDAPITLDVPDVEKKTDVKAEELYEPSPENKSTDTSEDEEWDWEYVDDEDDDAHDSEWEYIEESENDTLDRVLSAEDVGEEVSTITDDDYIYEEVPAPEETSEQQTSEQPEDEYIYEEVPASENASDTELSEQPADDTYEETPMEEETIDTESSEQPGEVYGNEEGQSLLDENSAEYAEQADGQYMYEPLDENGEAYAEQADGQYVYEEGQSPLDDTYTEYAEQPEGEYAYEEDQMPSDNTYGEYVEQPDETYDNVPVTDENQSYDDMLDETDNDEQA